MTTETDGKILRRLEKWQAGPEALPVHLQLYRDLLLCQHSIGPDVTAPKRRLGAEAAIERLSVGMPLLTFDELDIDWSLLPDMFCQVVAVVARYPQVSGEFPQGLLEKPPSTSWLREAARLWFEAARLPPMETGDCGDEDLVAQLIQASLRPFLVGHGSALIGLVDQETWRRGYCPVCGGSSDIALLDKENGARWLLCSRCDAQWLFQRLQCPYCNTTKQSALSYLTDDKGAYRLYLCDCCKCYLKAIDLRQADHEVLLPLERYLMLPYDTQALSEGYTPGDRKRSLQKAPA
ncbi:MAG: formate dehydrogenase accessory protein FdhE [Dehalococcoidia bacterium]|nr:formate dehydrogenase accessory protein FdhE [Dehalococcoidia bacterium]